MDYFNQDYDDFFKKACKENLYSQVFFLPPWKAIYKTDNERFETFEEVINLNKHLISTYKQFGYNLIEVPFGSIEYRTNYILNYI